jgi:hypothetical protein
MTLKGEEGGVPQEKTRGDSFFPLSLFRGSFSSNNNGRVKSPLFIQPQFGPGSAEKWEGREGGVFQNPTTLPFFFFLPQRGSRSLFVDGLLSWNPAKERGPTFPS